MPTATTKTYQVPYEIVDTPAKIPVLIEQLAPNGFTVNVHAYFDPARGQGGEIVYELTIHKTAQPGVNLITVPMGNAVVLDKGVLYSFTKADALTRYNI